MKKLTSLEKMESYSTEIKQMRILRRKYEPSDNSPLRSGYCLLDRPYTPPPNYLVTTNEFILINHHQQQSYQEISEDVRPTLH